MVDTKLESLAQNLEIEGGWPIKQGDETPSKYLDFSWQSLKAQPVMMGNPQNVDLLISILKETMAFDDPFGDMVDTVELATEEDDNLDKRLQELNIPVSFPLEYSGLSETTLSVCKGEGVTTIGEFATFAGRMAQNVYIGGDFKELLNALITKNEPEIARFLPYRAQDREMHFVETIGIFLDKMSAKERMSLLKHYGYKLSEKQAAKAKLSGAEVTQLEEILEAHFKQVSMLFGADLEEIREQLQDGTAPERCFILLNNEENELIAGRITARMFKMSSPKKKAQAKKPGFFARLFGRK